MNLSIYRIKPDQGRLTRGIAFLLLTFLIYYGCWTLYYFLHWPWAKQPLIEGKIPILNLPFDVGLVVSIVLFLLLEWIVIKVINQQKMGTLLIETETEMKKVTWPTWNESFNSSIVVLIAVVFFMLFLGLSDIVLNFIFDKIIFQGLA